MGPCQAERGPCSRRHRTMARRGAEGAPGGLLGHPARAATPQNDGAATGRQRATSSGGASALPSHDTVHVFPTCSQTLDDSDSRAAPLRQLEEGGAEQQELSQKKTATGAQWWPFWREPDRGMSWPKGKELFHGYCSHMYSADTVFLTFRHARPPPAAVCFAQVNCTYHGRPTRSVAGRGVSPSRSGQPPVLHRKNRVASLATARTRARFSFRRLEAGRRPLGVGPAHSALPQWRRGPSARYVRRAGRFH